jgi:hypothetical protein
MTIVVTLPLFVHGYQLGDDIFSVVAANNEIFFKHFIDTLPDKDSDDDTDILVAAATLFYEHNEAQV